MSAADEGWIDLDADGAMLLDDAEGFLATYVAFPSEHARVAVTLWAVHAHLVAASDNSPRLALLSPEPGSGKTRVLEVLELLVPAPMHVLSASPPAIFRTIAAARPTLLFDEVDAIFGRRGKDDNNEDLRALLNAGHRRGATIPRCVGPSHEVHLFPVHAAVALAGLGDLPDTLMSRSIVVRMRRRAPGETIRPFRHRLAQPEGNALRARLVDWAGTVEDVVRDAWPDMPKGVTDRPADVWEPLLAVADAAGGRWPERARAACVALTRTSVARDASLGVRLLVDLRTIFGDEDRLATETILARLCSLDESPWADLRGRALDSRGLARRLGAYEVASTQLKIDGQKVRGYRREDLWDGWQRYCGGEDPDPDGAPDPGGTVPAVPVVPGWSEGPDRVPDDEAVPVPPTQPVPETPPLSREVPQVPEVPHPRTPEPDGDDRGPARATNPVPDHDDDTVVERDGDRAFQLITAAFGPGVEDVSDSQLGRTWEAGR